MNIKNRLGQILMQLKLVRYSFSFVLILALGVGFFSLFLEASARHFTPPEAQTEVQTEAQKNTKKDIKHLPERFQGNPAFKLFIYAAGKMLNNNNMYNKNKNKKETIKIDRQISSSDQFRNPEIKWLDVKASAFSLTPEQISQIEKRESARENYKKNYKKNNRLRKISSESTGREPISTEFESLNQCSKNRKFYEREIIRQIIKSPKIKELLAAPENNEATFSKKCITHSMNTFAAPSSSYAYCARSAGPAKSPAAKPCVTENLVHLTYNSYMDVTTCLNLDPKLLMPKINNESGFFINTYGLGQDGGLGQLTRPAIMEVNKYFKYYMSEITKAAATKPACARLLKFKSYLTKASVGVAQRCSLIGLPENPLRNIFYMAVLNRINMDQLSGVKYIAGVDYLKVQGSLVEVKNNALDEFAGKFATHQIKKKLEWLGIKNPNLHFFKEITGLVGYNTGVQTALNILNRYLNVRIAKKMPLTLADFDFNNPEIIKDEISGEDRNVVSLARSYVMSSFINSTDEKKIKLIKVKRRKKLPKLWKQSFSLTFPEYLAYNANSYNGKTTKPYEVYGFPGYLNLVTSSNKAIRLEFEKAGFDANQCSDPDFLKMKN